MIRCYFLLLFVTGSLLVSARQINIPKNPDGGWYKPRLPKIRPGDTIILRGNYAYWNLENINGTTDSPVVFMNKNGRSRVGTANNYAAIFYNSSHFVIDGGGDSTIRYGIVFGPKEVTYISLGLTVGNSTDYEIKNVEITHTQVGIYGNPDTGRTMRRIRIHHNWIHDLDNPAEKGRSEGMYLGNSSIYTVESSAHFEDIRIYENLLEELSGDAIQLCNAQGYQVYNNKILNYGKSNLPSQRTGILIGSNSFGEIRGNLIENGYGSGIQVFGYSTHTIENNSLKQTAKGLMLDAISIEKKGLDGAPLKVNCLNNTIEGANRNGITNHSTKLTGRPGNWVGNKVSGVGGKKFLSLIGDHIK
ncbi:MAG: hypothetical protein JWQ27_655 [Ferruginibacter sp.]|nr:hypothetical protein [Ferruginibacter sp.]